MNTSIDDSAHLRDLLCIRARDQAEQLAYIFLSPKGKTEKRLAYGDLNQQAWLIGSQLQQHCTVGECALLFYPAGLDYKECNRWNE